MNAGYIPISSDFNPRSREGSDSISRIFKVRIINNFNPRSREGSDCSRSAVEVARFGFQSTLPRGERLRLDHALDYKAGFQSTLPRGERHGLAIGAYGHLDFNPRSREGSDAHGRIYPIMTFQISIHAPARGATGSGVSAYI